MATDRIMATISTALTTWEEFVELPDPEDGSRYELHDGEVVVVPPVKPIHLNIQSLLTEWLLAEARGRGRAFSEYGYRPTPDLQYWYADIAFVPKEDWERILRSNEYRVYAPPLVVEVLSPSNRRKRVQRQRITAFSAGTREFWIIDPTRRTIEVSVPGATSRIYTIDEEVPVTVLPGSRLPVRILFAPDLPTT